MQKIASILALSVSLLISGISISQTVRKIGKSHAVSKPQIPAKISQNAPGCDTLNIIPDDANLTVYTVGDLDDPPDGIEDGYVTGTNAYEDLQKANFFDISATANTYLTGVIMWFAYGNGADLSKIVPIRVYDGTTGGIGAEIGSTDVTLQEIYDSVIAGSLNEFKFNPAISLPASKKFFISVDMSNLDWYVGDTLALVGTEFGGVHNAAWEEWSDNSWHAFSDANNWGDSMILVMLPLISTNAECRVVVPVKMQSFTAASFGSVNKLNWSTATETNNNGFVAERSADGIRFTTIGFVASKGNQGNSSRLLTYSVTDDKPFAKNTYYRIKQLDKSGKESYSNTVLVNRLSAGNTGIISFYPNPVKNVLKLVLTSASIGDAGITVTDITGKTLLQNTIKTTGSNQNMELNVSAFAKGTYFIRTSGSAGSSTIKFVKD